MTGTLGAGESKILPLPCPCFFPYRFPTFISAREAVAGYLSTVSVIGNVFYFHLPSLFLKCSWRNLGTTLVCFVSLHFPVLLIFLDYKDIPSGAVA